MGVIKPWSTNYPSSQDTGTDAEDQQPTLVNGADDTRVSQIHALREKVHYIALKVGDNSNLPAGCHGAKIAALESAPPAHKTTHESGGSDAIKLDDLATPDDNTDLDATTGRHGLLPKLGGGTSNFLRADGSWASPSGGAAGTDRCLVLSDGTEYTEAGNSLATALDFEIIRDSGKSITAWRVVIALKMSDGAGGAPSGDTGECQVTIGGDALGSPLQTTSSSWTVLAGTISPLISSEDAILTGMVQIRNTAGSPSDTVHIKCVDIYAVY